jgi:fimbrial chaperone protein
MIRSAVATLAVLVATLSLPAGAASLHVWPVSLKMQPGQAAVGLTLENQGDLPLAAQVRVFSWTQNIGEDRLTEQQAVQVSPPITTIPAHGQQVVRVIRLGPVSTDEQTYRLLIDELPDLNGHNGDRAVDIRLRYSIPLFVTPAGPHSPAILRWDVEQHDGQWFLKASNSGQTHVQISAVKLTNSDGSQLEIATGLLGYALAGLGREWPLPAGQPFTPSAGVKVNAMIDQTPMQSRANIATGSR